MNTAAAIAGDVGLIGGLGQLEPRAPKLLAPFAAFWFPVGTDKQVSVKQPANLKPHKDHEDS